VRAEEVYIDPSALTRLYIQQAGSREISVWRAKSLDLLHVAGARELRRRYLLTFDERQQQLAAAAGLKVARL
jgi:hypothetical protein